MLSDRPAPPDDGQAPPDELHGGGPIPMVVPPLPRENQHARNLPWSTALGWLRAGWLDLVRDPLPSLIYGLGTAAVSAFVVWNLFLVQLDYLLLPALSGFMVVGPLIANGLYEKSRRLELGEPTSLASVLFVRPRSSYQALFMGVLLLGLFLLWIRAAVILYALFFGLKPFPGTDEVVPMLLFTPTGWALLLVGSAVGGLFAAFAFAISVFAVPMLLEERTDALTAMGISMAMVWNNLAVMIAWGATVLLLFVLSLLTGFIGLILVFPVLGHGTWHAYRALRVGSGERMFIQPA